MYNKNNNNENNNDNENSNNNQKVGDKVHFNNTLGFN